MFPEQDVFPVGPSGVPSTLPFGQPVEDVFSINANEPWQNPPISIHFPIANNGIPGSNPPNFPFEQ
jgi:hypothetical protein